MSFGLRAVRMRTSCCAAVHRGPARRLLRLRVLASYLRLLPKMLARRRAIDAARKVSRAELERWLVPRG